MSQSEVGKSLIKRSQFNQMKILAMKRSVWGKFFSVLFTALMKIIMKIALGVRKYERRLFFPLNVFNIQIFRARFLNVHIGLIMEIAQLQLVCFYSLAPTPSEGETV